MANVYRADHVGSLLPEAPVPAGGESEAVKALLAMQKHCGIDIVTDGELLRAYSCSQFVGTVQGVQSDASGVPYVAEPMQRASRLTAAEVHRLQGLTTSPFKITLPAPTVAAMALFREGVTSAHYPTRRDLAEALAAILRQEIADLIADGVPYVQLNGPAYEAAADRAGAARFGTADQMLSLDTEAVRGLQKPDKCTLALHLPRARDDAGVVLQNVVPGKRAAIVEAALARAPIDRLLIELPVEAAAADLAPLRAVPSGKMAVLGMVDPLAPRADDIEPLLDRLDIAATYIGAERLALSPQWGFGPGGAAHDRRAAEAQRRALTLTAETARRFWGFEM